MIISHKHKFIFVHVVRSGGTSIESVLKNYGQQYRGHIKFYQIKDQFGGNYDHASVKYKIPHLNLKESHEFDDYFKFVFIRNLPDWLVSLHKYNCRGIATKHTRKFPAAIKAWTTEKPHPSIGSYKLSTTKFDRHRFVLDNEKNLIPDYIGRFEHLQEDLDHVCERVGIPNQQLPHLNAASGKPWQEYYNSELKDFVNQYWAFDIEKLGVNWDA